MKAGSSVPQPCLLDSFAPLARRLAGSNSGIGVMVMDVGATSTRSVVAGTLSSDPKDEVGSKVSISVMGAGLSNDVKVLSSTLVVDTFKGGPSPVGNKLAVSVTVTVTVIVTVRVRPSSSLS